MPHVGLPGPVALPKTPTDASLIYKNGAGFLPAPNNVWPAAFKMVSELKNWWKSHGGAVYSINAVSVATAVCVLANASSLGSGGGAGVTALNLSWLLYMSPSAAHNAAHFFTKYFGSYGPWVNNVRLPAVDSRVANYVVICANPLLGYKQNWVISSLLYTGGNLSPI